MRSPLTQHSILHSSVHTSLYSFLIHTRGLRVIHTACDCLIHKDVRSMTSGRGWERPKRVTFQTHKADSKLYSSSKALLHSSNNDTQLPKTRRMTNIADSTVSPLAHSPRLPRSVQAIYLRPLQRSALYGIPSCDLQMRSYSARNLELMADFVMRAAYYLGMPAAGPVPLPRLVERWTVSRSVFAHKKSQENFERITLRRLIQIKDAHIDTINLWLAFIRKNAYYGVGLKASIWEHERLGPSAGMDVQPERAKRLIDQEWVRFGRRKTPHTADQIMGMLRERNFRRSENYTHR